MSAVLRARLSPRGILVVAWLVFLIATYPGFMPADAADQLVDARVGEVTDWHSPVMSQIWRILGIVISGPPGMLLLQSGLLLVGMYQLLRRTLSARAAATCAGCVLLFPQVLGTAALISPEGLMASLLAVAAVALLADDRTVRVGGLALAALAAAVHDAGVAATFPLVLGTFRWSNEARARRVGIALAAWVCVACVAVGLVQLAADVRTQRKEVALAMADIIGTLRSAPPLEDGVILATLDGVPLAVTTRLQERARHLDGRTGRYANGDERFFEHPATPVEREALIHARRVLALEAPGGYLRHRWRHFTRVVGLRGGRRWPPLYTEFVAHPEHVTALHHSAHHSLLQQALLRPYRALSHTIAFRPYIYIALALVLVAIAAAQRQRLALLLLGSGLSYSLALMFVTARVEARDSFWATVCTTLAAIVAVHTALRGKHAASRPR